MPLDVHITHIEVSIELRANLRKGSGNAPALHVEPLIRLPILWRTRSLWRLRRSNTSSTPWRRRTTSAFGSCQSLEVREQAGPSSAIPHEQAFEVGMFTDRLSALEDAVDTRTGPHL